MKKAIPFLCILLILACKQEPKNTKLSGPVFGTSYSATYNSNINYESQLDSLFYVINKSMSTYQTNSIISKLNRNEAVQIDDHFTAVFKTSKRVHSETEGAFDPTIGAVVNAWDFGPDGRIEQLDSLKIDSLMLSVGLQYVTLENRHIKKKTNTFLDFNAIAKGYAVDVLAEFLESQGIQNYLVEIGGEIRAKGYNTEKNSLWRVGVDEPRFDGEQSVLKAISLTDEAMATSGIYRKFKVDEEGNRYAHIINTKNGYPSKSNILSISVIHKECMIADAYATAFQAMGIDKVKAFLKKHPELKVFLILENDKKELETISFNGFP